MAAESGIKNETKQVAEMTLNCLKENVPKDVPGIAFLSGGQTELEATKNLNEINKINNSNFIMSYLLWKSFTAKCSQNLVKRY